MSQELELLELVDEDDFLELEPELEEMEITPDELGISKKDQEDFGPRKKDIDAAKAWINVFFAGKQMYYGGDIPPATLHSPAFIDRVLTLDIGTGIKNAYDLIERTGAIETSYDEESTPADISIVVGLLEECHQVGVPKYYAAGIVLIALELCYGVVAPLSAARSGF